MEDKYYTPELNEFYWGFDFEVYNSREHYFFEAVDGWHKAFMDYGVLGDIKNIDRLLLDKQIRVKYLDREDIESLGWKKRLGTHVEIYYLHWPEEEGNYTGVWLEKKGNLWTITNCMTKINFMQFWGLIKNKSELKKLMQQLLIK